jgi:hypothetical protein
MKMKKIMTGYLVFSLLAGLGLSIWRTVLLYQYFDPYNNAYAITAKSNLRGLGYVMLACILIALTSALVLRKKEFDPVIASANHFSVFASSLLGCLFAAAGILVLIYYPHQLFAPTGTTFFRALLLVAFISLFFSAMFFIFSASTRYDGTRIKTVLSIFPALFAVTLLCASYLSPDFVFSNSNDLLRNVALASLVLFFLQEARAVFYGKTEFLRFSIAMAALICVIAYNLPTLIVTAFWEFELTYMTMFELVECGAIIYMIATACTMIGTLHRNEESTPTNSEL